MPIKQVCLFPAHPPEFVHRQGYLFPPRFKIDVSDSPGFEVAATIVSFEKSSFPNPGNNAITFTGGNRAGRYVRLTALELSNSLSFFRFALAEMQVWSNGTNVALGKSVTASDSFEKDGWSRAALVDGFNSQANIVDWSPWLAALSQRRELSQQLAELERQRGFALNGLVAAGMWGAAGLVIVAFLGLLFFLWKQRWQRRRELDALRLRISQDLHDEVGSNLGTIALISHGLLTAANDPAQTRNSLEEIQTISRQTADSMRDIARLIQSDAYGQGDLSMHLREIAARMLRNVPHQLNLDACDVQKYLRVDQQRDLVLMFTEALNNIVRHAHATQVSISLTGAGGIMTLTVQDNGRGFLPDVETSSGMGLANIRRRAEKFGGEIRITSRPAQGTTLAITLPAV
jgi:signal transduction histidine kinase